jgi:molybdopterin converting factor small subunit
MAFQKPKVQPNFATLKSTLAQVKSKDNALYQTIQILIERLMQFQGITVETEGDINDSINNVNSVVNNLADKTRTYITGDDEVLNLPNSLQLLAGTNITFDTTVPNKLTLNVSAAVDDYVVLSDGVTPTPLPIDDGFGNFVYVAYTP